MKPVAALALAAALSIALPASARRPQQSPSTTFRSGTALVEVDLIVKDKDGNFVSGLTADDFEVLEEGRPQRGVRAGIARRVLQAAALLLCACSPAVIQSGAGSSGQGAAVVGAVPAAAPPHEPRRVTLTYQAPASCPGYDGYVRHVRDRSATLLVDPLPPKAGETSYAVKRVAALPGERPGIRGGDLLINQFRCWLLLGRTRLFHVLLRNGSASMATL